MILKKMFVVEIGAIAFFRTYRTRQHGIDDDGIDFGKLAYDPEMHAVI